MVILLVGGGYGICIIAVLIYRHAAWLDIRVLVLCAKRDMLLLSFCNSLDLSPIQNSYLHLVVGLVIYFYACSGSLYF